MVDIVDIATIDFASFNESDPEAMRLLASSVSDALTDSGFMKIRNLGVSQVSINRAFELSRWFFEQSEAQKAGSAYTSAEENFGYQSLGVEHLGNL